MAHEIYVTTFIQANLTRLDSIATGGIAATLSISGGTALGSNYLCINLSRLRAHFGERVKGLHAANSRLAQEIAQAYAVHADRDCDTNPLVETLDGQWIYYLRE